MANTPIPRIATEMAVRPCSDMEEYTLSPAELEEIRRRYPAPEQKRRPKPPIEIKTGGNQMAKEGPDSGVTKRILLEGLAAGKTVRDLETEYGMKQNTLSYWVKKWGVEGISRDQAKVLLGPNMEGTVPPTAPAKSAETEAQKPEQRIQELTSDRDRLAAENRSLHARLIDANDRADEAERRERAAHIKTGEHIQAIRELEERIRDLESSAAEDVMLVPKERTELQRIDSIIEDLSRARWILERVAT
ncbi:hypothetical protein B9G55_01350 [Saccharibacillus sp. O16]|nr:hypothetical protein B9G55_01350 [Saccharibacillus sp. O16]